MFGPSVRSNEPTMPSADLCNFFPSPRDDSSQLAKLQISPGNALSPSRLCPPHLHTIPPYRYWTLKRFAFSSRLHASYAISVRQASALPAASFRFHLAMDTLADRLTIPPVGFVGDFHSRVRAPCRAHKAKSPREQNALAGFRINPGDFLLSHAVSRAVPSAPAGLTSVFGMGTGVTLPTKSPENLLELCTLIFVLCI